MQTRPLYPLRQRARASPHPRSAIEQGALRFSPSTLRKDELEPKAMALHAKKSKSRRKRRRLAQKGDRQELRRVAAEPRANASRAEENASRRGRRKGRRRFHPERRRGTPQEARRRGLSQGAASHFARGIDAIRRRGSRIERPLLRENAFQPVSRPREDQAFFSRVGGKRARKAQKKRPDRRI